MSPKSALPKHLQDSDWSGTDNASWLMRQKKKLQTLLAAGPRVPSGFFKWREYPKVLLALRGKGLFRFEETDGSSACVCPDLSKLIVIEDDIYHGDGHDEPVRMYLSRIQPWCRWHVSLQWPLFFNCHIIYRKRNVVEYPRYQSAFGISKMLTFGIGFKRDGDKVYWLSANIGGNFE